MISNDGTTTVLCLDEFYQEGNGPSSAMASLKCFEQIIKTLKDLKLQGFETSKKF